MYWKLNFLEELVFGINVYYFNEVCTVAGDFEHKIFHKIFLVGHMGGIVIEMFKTDIFQ